MSDRETASAISDSAAEWVARLDREGDDPRVRAELDAWLAGDIRRQGAWFRAQSAWTMLDRASAARMGQMEAAQEAEDAPLRFPQFSRRRILAGTGLVAASIVGALAGLRLRTAETGERIETAIGEIRRVPLKDGSIASVNTATRLAVDLRPELRRIAIDEGEAWFEVAHDRERPFIVESGDVRVRAVGTAFSVRRTGEGSDVQVTEGTVEVWSLGDVGNRRLVSAGAHTFVSDRTGPGKVAEASVDIERSLAWRSGQLIFDGDTLGAAAAEFNRYNEVQVRIADPGLAKERFVGRFHTNEPEAFARAAATILDAQAQTRDREIVLTRK